MISILFENDELIAVDKPEGVSVIAERGPEKSNLITLLSEQMGCRLYVVHRLDKEVSGVMLFAKNAQTHKYLNDLFSEHRILKTYYAVVHGSMSGNEGLIDKAIRECGSGRMAIDEKRGKSSRTTWQVVRSQAQYSRLQVNPHTGRRHQIRVHLYSIGHPIVGDRRYGDKELQSNYPRLFLHAVRIRLPWQNGAEIEIASSLPDCFDAF
jgi:tRNA pseudouridine32 synthase / 23S rRNA pseudouridine746 synthase